MDSILEIAGSLREEGYTIDEIKDFFLFVSRFEREIKITVTSCATPVTKFRFEPGTQNGGPINPELLMSCEVANDASLKAKAICGAVVQWADTLNNYGTQIQRTA